MNTEPTRHERAAWIYRCPRCREYSDAPGPCRGTSTSTRVCAGEYEAPAVMPEGWRKS